MKYALSASVLSFFSGALMVLFFWNLSHMKTVAKVSPRQVCDNCKYPLDNHHPYCWYMNFK